MDWDEDDEIHSLHSREKPRRSSSSPVPSLHSGQSVRSGRSGPSAQSCRSNSRVVRLSTSETAGAAFDRNSFQVASRLGRTQRSAESATPTRGGGTLQTAQLLEGSVRHQPLVAPDRLQRGRVVAGPSGRRLADRKGSLWFGVNRRGQPVGCLMLYDAQWINAQEIWFLNILHYQILHLYKKTIILINITNHASQFTINTVLHWYTNKTD